ncbi:MAG: histidine kinase [Bacteroidota bacterium]
MKRDAFFRNKTCWRRLARSLLIGFIGALLLLATDLCGQTDLVYPVFKPEIDFSSKNVYCYAIEIDSLQRKWIATSNGLYVYDGYELIHHQSVPREEILKSLMDVHGYLWLAYANGKIIRFNPYSETEVQQFSVLPSYGACLIQTQSQIIALSRKNGYFAYDLKKNQVSSPSDLTDHLDYLGIYQNDEDHVLLTLSSLLNSSKKSIYAEIRSNIQNRIHKRSNGFEIIGDSIALIGIPGAIWKYDLATGKNAKWLELPKSDLGGVIFIQKYKTGLLIGTYDGLYEVDIKTKSYTPLIKGLVITSVRMASNNDLWCSTMNDGLRVVHRGIVKMIDATVGTSYFAIDARQNKVVFGGENRKIGVFDLADGKTTFLESPSSRKSFEDCKDICIAESGIAIASTAMTAFFDHQYQLLYSRQNAPKNVFLNEGQLAIAKMSILDFHALDDFHLLDEMKLESPITKILDFTGNQVLACTRHKVIRFDGQQQQRFERYSNDSLAILDAQILEGGKIALLIESNQLLLIDEQQQQQSYNLPKQGFSGMGYFNESFFFTSGNEICAYRIEEGRLKKVLTCNFLNGLYTQKIFELSFLNNTIFVASNNGIFVIPLMVPQLQQARSNLTWEVIAGTDTLKSSSPQLTQAIQVNYNNSYVKITIKDTKFPNPDGLLYSYQANGAITLDKIDSGNELEFISLPEGKTTLEVKAWFNEVPISEAALFTITVTGPYWQNPFFISAIALLFVLIFYFFLQNKRKQIDLSLVIEKERLRALRAQMNPHFVFNSLNSIQHYIVENQPKPALKYLSSFSKLIRKKLEQSDKDYHSIQEEIAFLKEYLSLENNRLRTRFDYAFQIEESIDLQRTQIPTLILQPFVENAIWHGISKLPETQRGELSIQLHWHRQNVLQCCITDNGVGFKNDNWQEQGIGIKKTVERLNILSNDKDSASKINFVSKNPKGTIVSFLMHTHHEKN